MVAMISGDIGTIWDLDAVILAPLCATVRMVRGMGQRQMMTVLCRRRLAPRQGAISHGGNQCKKNCRHKIEQNS